LKFGLQSIFHRFEPSAIVAEIGALKTNANADIYNVVESGAYLEDTWTPVGRLKVNAGVRMSYFKTQTKTYVRPEPRLGVAYKIANGLAMKASYAKMNQFVHLLSNTSVGLPTDLWVPTTDKIAPEQSEQFATGFAKDLDKWGLTLTIEGYYKKMKNIVAYKEGSSFLSIDLNPDNPTANSKILWEDNVTAGNGYSYGAEFLLQKKVGRFSGWIGYTWSKTLWQFDELNFGKEFYPRYDRRHDLSLVGIYELNPKITFSSVWVYGTGNALTLPTSQIYLPVRRVDGYFNPSIKNVDAVQYFNARRVQEYGAKNSFRAEPYHRLDLSVQFHKKKRSSFERTWEVSAYNAYNRRNPFFYQIRNIRSKANPEIRRTVFQRVSLFPIVPSVTYAFKF
jgi:outer membrane receptor protein involved in Fe transport